MPQTCTVSGSLLRPDGTPLPFVPVRFAPAPAGARAVASGIVAPSTVVAQTDSAAAISVDLVPGLYSVTAEKGRLQLVTALIEVPEAANADLGDLLVYLPGPPRALDAVASAARAAAAAGAAEDAAAAALNSGQRVFATRAAAEAATVPAPVIRLVVGGLGYVADAAGTALATNGGARNWSPAGLPFADHFGENTAPGTTDMTDALRAAMAWAPLVHLGAATYRVTDTLRIYARNGAGLIGQGERSVIMADSGGWDVFRFYTGEVNGSGVPLACQNVQMRNLRIASSGAERTGGYFVNFEERCMRGVFDNLWLTNPHGGMRMVAAAYTFLTNLIIEAGSRTTTGGTALHFTSNEAAGVYVPSNSAGGAKVTDTHVSNLQINPQNPTLPNPFAQSVLIESADGLYISKSHLRGGTHAMVLRTSLAPNRTVIASVDVRETYFDAVEGSHVRFEGYGNDHEFQPAGGPAGQQVKFRSITFEGCRFRDAKSVQGSINASVMTEGAVARVAIRGGQIRDNRHSGIRDGDTDSGFFGLTVSDVEFSGNNRNGLESHGDIWVRDNGHALRDLDFKPSDVDTDVGYNIRVLTAGPADSAGATVVQGNNFALSPISVDARRLAVAPGVIVRGNVGLSDAPLASEIVAQGENANGQFIRYADGRQVVTRKVTLEGVDVETAYGALFRSTDLISVSLENQSLAAEFLTGTVPVFSIAARISNYPSLMLLAGAGSRTDWPSTVRVVADQSLSNRTVLLDLRAEGRWA